MPEGKSDLEVAKWLRMAINSEKQAIHDYLKYARMTENKEGKNMFIKIALDEYGHMSALEKELDNVQAGKKWEEIKLSESPVEKTLPALDTDSLSDEEKAGKNETQALAMAMKAEKKAKGFYLGKSCVVKDPFAKSLLVRLSEMEDAHYRILEAELDSINQSGFWLGIREISFEMS
ncbi:MAG: hypothetical protein HY811_09460 [Planctomycetes bacterium]|nr:hypothetical protein [Planctomycetota bacterium]